MRAKVKIEFCRVSDADVDSRAGRNIARLSGLLFLVRAEESGVVPLLNDDERDSGLVVGLQLDAGLSDCRELVLQNLKTVIASLNDDYKWTIVHSRYYYVFIWKSALRCCW